MRIERSYEALHCCDADVYSLAINDGISCLAKRINCEAYCSVRVSSRDAVSEINSRHFTGADFLFVLWNADCERVDELFGRSAAGFLAIGMLCGCWCAWKGRSLFASRLFWVWSSVTLLPLIGIFFSESLLLLTRLKLSWAIPIRSALRHSVFWHL